MTVKNYIVKQVNRNDIKDFIETWHYSKSINGVMGTFYFALYDKDSLIGAMIYGNLGMANAWKKYADEPQKVLELRRLCCIDDTPKNTESFFIGKTLRMLKQIDKQIEVIVSYADTNYNHTGIIYKASNFKYLGKTAKGKVIIRKSDNKIYHDKAIRTKYKGQLKPFAAKLKEQLENGEAYYKETQGKNIYLYNLK